MLIYGGIDEAGYGPLLGPMTLGRSVWIVRDAPPDQPWNLWQHLARGVCQSPAATGRKGRLAINDSKKLHASGQGLAGLRHLEQGVLVLGALGGIPHDTLHAWLTTLGVNLAEQTRLPWYQAETTRPWETLPVICDAGTLAIARNVLRGELESQGVEVADLGLAVVPEDRFNTMVAATRSKASVSFTFVAQHLHHIWLRFGEHHPLVAVDRQSGRSHYREPLSFCFPQAHLTVLEESDTLSRYRIVQGSRSMTVLFEVEGDRVHLPTAAASMIAKYARELLMHRFNQWFAQRLESAGARLKPTAGYAADGKRFLQELAAYHEVIALDQSQWVRAR